MSLIQTLRQTDIAARMDRATTFVAYVAPGVGDAAASALIEACRRLGNDKVTVVLDVSASSARAGYGIHQAVTRMHAAGILVRTESSLRLGLLICDAEGWAFTLPPRMVEDEATEDQIAPNAIALTPTQVIALRAELPMADTILPNADASLDVAGAFPVAGPIPSIGIRVAGRELLHSVDQDLERNPPRSFDLARQVHVFDSAIEFVELALEGWRITSRKVQMPKDLPIFAGSDAELNRRIDATFKLVERQEGSVLRDLEVRFIELRDAYLRPMGKYLGRVLIRSKRQEFEAKVAALTEQFNKAKTSLESGLQKSLDATLSDLVDRLAKLLLAMPNPPLKFQARYHGDLDGAKRFVRDRLERLVPKASTLVSGMRVHLVAKGVTLQMLKDPEFQRRFFEQVPREELARDLYAEYDAAKVRFDQEERRRKAALPKPAD